MTGETKQQKFLCTIGHSAQNGKSTLAKMFDNTFSIYSMKLDKQTFTKDYSKRQKQFALIRKPVRFVYIEEMDRNKLDGDVLKDFVDGDKINNEIMYGTSETIILQCKLNLISNNNINFDTDSGIKRRGYSQKFTNKFIPKDDYEKLK
jgi:phage/plasmid-associated DNA primase